jgi:tRNA(Ile)-lysidine synthase
MHLLAAWSRQRDGVPPVVLVVDHGLREGSSKEAAAVGKWAEALGLPAHVLRWQDNEPRVSGLEERARAARYRLMGEWCAANAIVSLFVAHTREDQAETFLLRLGRGSGVDGLAAMAACAPFPLSGFDRLRLVRPLLEVGRAELRAYLRAGDIQWFEDPMNGDARFARVRMRQVLPVLEASGISVQRIAEAANHLQRARSALDDARDAFLANHVRYEGETLLLDGAALARLPREISLRILSFVLMRVGRVAYRPRFVRLEALLYAVLSGQFAARTLSGCRVGMAPKALSVFGRQTLLVAPENQRRPKLERAKLGRERPRGKNPAIGRRSKAGSSDTFRDAE